MRRRFTRSTARLCIALIWPSRGGYPSSSVKVRGEDSGFLIGNDADGKMAIQERSNFFGPSITTVIDAMTLIIAIKRAGIAVTVAVAVTTLGFVGTAVGFASSTDRISVSPSQML